MGFVLDLPAATRAAEEIHADGKRIAFTNGCFDVFHAGHVRILRIAREAADVLFVGLNDDEGVRRLKGPGRPANRLEDRAEVLRAIRYVDHVVAFAEDTPIRLIKGIRPDALVKGADYLETEIVGAKEIKEWGGELIRVPLLEGRSSTRIIAGDVA